MDRKQSGQSLGLPWSWPFFHMGDGRGKVEVRKES